MPDVDLTPIERRQLGCARAQHAVFDAIYTLWEERAAEGLTQSALAEFLGRDPGWVCRTLSGPGNWTLRTFGELVEALDGYIDVKVLPRERLRPGNYDIYSDVLDGGTQTFCPLTDYRPQIQKLSGNVTLTITPSLPTASAASANYLGTVGGGLKRVAT